MYFLLKIIKTVEENEIPYNEILTAINSLYVGLIALMYPKIYEFKKDIFKESEYLHNKLSQEIIVKYGYIYLCCCIVFSIISSVFYISNNNYYKIIILLINFILVILSLVLSWYFYEKIYQTYTTNVSKIVIKDEICEFDKNDIQLLQDLALKTLNSNSMYYLNYKLFESFVNQIFKYFLVYQTMILEKKEDKHFVFNLLNDKDEYFLYPLERIQYINQQLIELKINDIDYNRILSYHFFKTIVDFYNNKNIQELFRYDNNIYLSPLREYRNNLLYKIENKNFEKNYYDLHYLNLLLVLSIKLIISKIHNNIEYIIEYIFLLVKKIIDFNYEDSYIIDFIKKNDYLFWTKKENDFNLLEDFKDVEYNKCLYNYYTNIHISILSYLFKVKKYNLLIKCVNLFIQDIQGNYRLKILSISLIFNILIYKTNSIFNKNNLLKIAYDNETYNENNNIKYKYYIIFIFFINIKNSIDSTINYIKDVKKSKIENKDEIIKSKIKHHIKSNLTFGLQNNLLLIDIQNIEFDKIEELLKHFFSREDLLNLFKSYEKESETDFYIDLNKVEEYKKFIKKRFRLLKYKIEKYKKTLMSIKIDDIQSITTINDINKAKYDEFYIKNNLTMDNFSFEQFKRNYMEFVFYGIFDNIGISKLYNNLCELNTTNVKTTNELEKFYFLNLNYYRYEYKEYIKNKYYYSIYDKISYNQNLQKIDKSVEEITNNLDNYIIICNKNNLLSFNKNTDLEIYQKIEEGLKEIGCEMNFNENGSFKELKIKEITFNKDKIFTFDKHNDYYFELLLIDKTKVKFVKNNFTKDIKINTISKEIDIIINDFKQNFAFREEELESTEKMNFEWRDKENNKHYANIDRKIIIEFPAPFDIEFKDKDDFVGYKITL